MASNDRNDRQFNRNRNSNQGRPQHGPQRTVQVHARGEQIQLTFEPRYQGDGVIAVLDDGTMVNPGSLRFNPRPGIPYQCSVHFKEGPRGRRGSALPTLADTLTAEEWLTDEEYRKALVVVLTFERRGGGCVAFHQGWVVLPEDDVRVETGVPLRCQIREAGSVLFARPLSKVNMAQAGSAKTTAKTTLADTGLARLANSNPDFVQLKRPQAKPGTAASKPADVIVTLEARSVWELLSKQGRTVTAKSTAEEIKAAAKECVCNASPEMKLRPFGGPDKAPYVVRLAAEYYHEAVKEAAKRALAACGAAGKPAANPSPAAATKPSAPVSVPRPTSAVAAPTAQPATGKSTVDSLEDALEAWVEESRPTERNELESYLMRGFALYAQAATACESEGIDKRNKGDHKGAERELFKANELKRYAKSIENELA